MSSLLDSFLLFSLPKSISVSALFIFNVSLNDKVPQSPMWLSIGFIHEKATHDRQFLLPFDVYLRVRLRTVNEVFVLSDSLKTVAPASPISLPIDLENWIFVNEITLNVIILLILTTQIECFQ